MTSRSKALRNCATWRVGMERVEVRFPCGRGCMTDSWIIPSKRIQNSGLMSIVTEKTQRKHYKVFIKQHSDICMKNENALKSAQTAGIELQTFRTPFLAMRTLSILSYEEVKQHLARYLNQRTLCSARVSCYCNQHHATLSPQQSYMVVLQLY